MFSAQYSIRSPIRRRCGSGANSHSFCAMYSLKMSVCSVPLRTPRSTPWRSAATRYMQKTGTAGPLIVIDVVTSLERDARRTAPPCRRPSRSRRRSGRPRRGLSGSSESRPIRVGMSKATDRPPPPALEDHLVALVGLLGVAEAGELPDRPGAAAVAGGVEAAGERELPRPADPLEVAPSAPVGRPVDRLDRRCRESVVKSASRTWPRAWAASYRCLPAGAGRRSSLGRGGCGVLGRHAANLLGRPSKCHGRTARAGRSP